MNLTPAVLLDMPDGRIVKSDGRFGYASYRNPLGYKDKLAVVVDDAILGTAEVLEKEGADYRLRFQFGGVNQDLSNARVVLLEHDIRYFANASQGQTEGGRLSKPYTAHSGAVETFDMQVRNGSLKQHSGTVQDFNGQEATFEIRWQQGHSGPTSLSGTQIRTTGTFNSQDPMQVLRIGYKSSRVWFSADRSEAGKDARSNLRNGRRVKVYYRPTGATLQGSHHGQPTRETSAQAELIILQGN